MPIDSKTGIVYTAVMRRFIGRKKELAEIRGTFDSRHSEFRVVRGRRRVGKTSLLQEAAKDRDDVVFLSGLEDITSDRKIRNRFTERLAEFSGNAILASARDLSWPQLFQIVLEIAAQKKNLILIFDEIQWLARQGSGFLSDLKEAWTIKFQPSEKIKVIICGSSSKFFEHKTGGIDSVLHKLRTMSDICVPPMTLSETGLFCKGWNEHEIALTQMMFGGIPYYLDLISEPQRGFMQCINKIVFTANTIFFDEVKETLKLDISSLDRSIQLLEVAGQDGKTMSQIAEDSLVPPSTVDELLGKMVDYQILSKSFPMGENPKAKDFGVRYYIRDEFLNFFFNVLEREERRIGNNVSGKMIFSNVLKNGYYIENFTGKAFELIIRKIIERNLPAKINKILSIDNLTDYEVGSFWKTNGEGNQIDLIVNSSEDRCVRIIEVKWSNQKIGTEGGNAIEQVLGRTFPNRKRYKLRRFVVASSGFTDAARSIAQEHDVGLIDLEDLFDELES